MLLFYASLLFALFIFFLSLQDVIRNFDIKLDWDFKLSLLTDLVRVSKHLFTVIAMFLIYIPHNFRT